MKDHIRKACTEHMELVMAYRKPQIVRLGRSSDRAGVVETYRLRGFFLARKGKNLMVFGKRKRWDRGILAMCLCYGLLPLLVYAIVQAWKPETTYVEVHFD